MKEKYERYLVEWNYRYKMQGVPWGMSNQRGDPYSYEEWLEHDYLHNY